MFLNSETLGDIQNHLGEKKRDLCVAASVEILERVHAHLTYDGRILHQCRYVGRYRLKSHFDSASCGNLPRQS